MQYAKKYSVPSRAIIATNDKVYKKAEKIKLAARSDASIFAQLLLYTRRKLKHKGIQLIEAGTNDWFNLKEVCKLATDFCNEFQVDIKKGYKEYLEIAMGMMKGFSINKFKSLHQGICTIYESQLEIESDKTPEETRGAHDHYLRIISERTGFTQGFTNQVEKYRFFIKVKEEAKKVGVSVQEWIEAQFYAFEYKAGIPDPAQLVGIKAMDRVQKYCFEKGIKMGKKETKINFDKIRNERKGYHTIK